MNTTGTGSIAGLMADGPDPEFKEKLMLFGQFVGDWDIEARYPQPDGSEIIRRGDVHFGWILKGRAVQDVWMTSDQTPPSFMGTTIRFYDLSIDAWHSIWIASNRGLVRSFLGRKVGDEIVLKTKTKEGFPEHWIFSEIKRESLRWRAQESHDDGKTWQLTEEMRIHRKYA